jgi:exodeoxyribonuclease-3
MERTIISYNVNGIRAAVRKGFNEWFEDVKPDVLLIQETKAWEEDINTDFYEAMGYHCFVHSAQKKGYSGVMAICKEKPNHVEYGIGETRFDAEGRLMRLDFGEVTIINSYFPSGTTGDIRQDFKYEYLDAVQEYIDALKQTRPKIVIAGDFNICHKAIDISRPEKKKNVSGFLPAERAWVSEFLERGFVDAFRAFDQSPDKYSWWSYRANARAKNLGWRIDYLMVSVPLKDQMQGAGIHQDIVHSDHCPVSLKIDF